MAPPSNQATTKGISSPGIGQNMILANGFTITSPKKVSTFCCNVGVSIFSDAQRGHEETNPFKMRIKKRSIFFMFFKSLNFRICEFPLTDASENINDGWIK